MKKILQLSHNFIKPTDIRSKKNLKFGGNSEIDKSLQNSGPIVCQNIEEIISDKPTVDFINGNLGFYTKFFNNYILNRRNCDFIVDLSKNPTFLLKNSNKNTQYFEISLDSKNNVLSKCSDKENGIISVKFDKDAVLQKSYENISSSSASVLKAVESDWVDNFDKFSVIIKKYKEFICFLKKEYCDLYLNYLENNIFTKTDEIKNILSTIDRRKKYYLLQSYEPRVPFSTKMVFKFKDMKSVNKEQYAIIPHRKGENRFFRIVKYDRLGEMQDAYLIDRKNGIVKNYCTSKVFNNATTSYIPKDLSVMSKDELKQSKVCEYLQTYYNLLDDFCEYIKNNKNKSERAIIDLKKQNATFGFTRIKTDFVDKINSLFDEQNTDTLELKKNSNNRYIAVRHRNDKENIIELRQIIGAYETVARIDADTAKIFQVRRNGENLKDKKNNNTYYSHVSELFENKVKVMKNFLTQMVEKTQDENNNEGLQNLKKSFEETIKIWNKITETKRINLIKSYPDYIKTIGSFESLKFKIPNKNYNIEVKTHLKTSNDYKRMTVTDSNNNIIDVFLIEKYRSVVDNYCNSGRLSRDALSRIPNRPIYKTKSQIADSGFDSYLKEYITALENFKIFAKENSRDKRLKS